MVQLLTTSSVKDEDDITSLVVDSVLGDKLSDIVLSDKRVPLSDIHNLYIKMSIYLSDRLSKYDKLVKQLFYTFTLCRVLRKKIRDHNPNLHEKKLDKIVSKIVFPFFIRYCSEARNLISRLIGEVIHEKKQKYPSIVEKYLAHYDELAFRADLMLYFVVKMLRRYDPRTIDKPSAFYSDVMRRIIDYYFTNKIRELQSIDFITYLIEMDYSGVDSKVSNMYSIYYTAIVDSFYSIKRSNCILVQTILSYYDIFKDVICPIDLRLVFVGKFLPQILYVLKVRDLVSYLWLKFNHDMVCEELSDFPEILKLLSCIQIRVGTESTVYGTTAATISELMATWIKHKFKGCFDSDWLSKYANKIGHRFANYLLNGEYIDLITLRTMQIDGYRIQKEIIPFLDKVYDSNFTVEYFKQLVNNEIHRGKGCHAK